MTSQNSPALRGRKRWGLRLAAGIGAAAIGAMALTAPALAAEYGDIDTAHSGSITLHKHEHQSNAPIVTGNPEGPAPTLPDPISGIVFTAYPLTDFSVTDSTDWAALGTTTVPTGACTTPSLAGWNLGAGIPFAATDGNGITSLSTGGGAGQLPGLGAYLICESPNAAVSEAAAPFVVTLPYSDVTRTGATNGWVYNVHAYPKNTRAATIQKTVSPQGSNLGIGSVLEFPTTTSVPRIPAANVYTEYSIIDPMDPRLGSATGGVHGFVKSVQYRANSGAALADVPAANYQVFVSNNVVTVQFTQAGLAWLKANVSGGEIVTTFHGRVTSLTTPPIGSWTPVPGQIVNTAGLATANEPGATPPTPPTPPTYPPTPPTTPPGPPGVPPTTTPQVQSNWGDVQLWKRDNTGTGADANRPLTGAVFEVYEAETPYAATAAACSNVISTTNPTRLTVNGSPTFTSTNGVVTIPGLFVSDNQNAPIDNAFRCYVVREVQAPAGYVLPTGAAANRAVAVHTGQTAINTTTGANADDTIDNQKQAIPGLPLTGAQAQLIMMVGGGLLVAFGAAAAVVASRRKKGAAEAA